LEILELVFFGRVLLLFVFGHIEVDTLNSAQNLQFSDLSVMHAVSASVGEIESKIS